MTRYLWTDHSEYCICTHHVSNHDTKHRIVTGKAGLLDIKLQEYYICNECSTCTEFRSYKIDCNCVRCQEVKEYDQQQKQ